MIRKRILTATVLGGVLALAHLTSSQAAERGHDHGTVVENDGVGFAIQGEHFNALPIDAGTLQPSNRGPDLKLDDEESTAPQGD